MATRRNCMQCLGGCRERRARHILGAEAESLRQDTTRRLGGRYQCHLGVTVCERLGTACRLSARGQTPENLDNWLKRCPCLWRFRCRLVASPPPVSKGQPFSVGLFHCGMAQVRGLCLLSATLSQTPFWGHFRRIFLSVLCFALEQSRGPIEQ